MWVIPAKIKIDTPTPRFKESSACSFVLPDKRNGMYV
jgi:hypothetical protein